MRRPAALPIGWLCALPIMVSCSGPSGSEHPSSASTVSTHGTLTVSWSPPTRNSDGTPAKDLIGYTIFYGRGPKAYTDKMSIDDPSATRAIVRGLQPGAVYYFAVAAHNAAGQRSVLTPEVHGTARAE